MIPIIALLIPIVAILSGHQRKMAEIIHQNNRLPNGEVEALRQEIRELRHLMHQQAIAIDDVRSRQTLGSPTVPTDVRERLAGS